MPLHRGRLDLARRRLERIAREQEAARAADRNMGIALGLVCGRCGRDLFDSFDGREAIRGGHAEWCEAGGAAADRGRL